jgi:hypothetical protein
VKSSIVLLRVLALLLVFVANVDAQRITHRESRGEVYNRVTISTVVTAINDAPRISPRVAALKLSPQQIRIVDVRPYIPAGKRKTYATALVTRAKDITALRTTLVSVDTAIHVLEASRPALNVDDVVAAGIMDVIETGKSMNVLVLYVDRQNTVGRAAGPNGGNPVTVAFAPTTSSLMAALQTTPEMVARVSVINTLRADRVKFYDIDAIVKPADAESYRSAVIQNENAIRLLRAELSKRPLVMHALSRYDAKLMLGDIFAADILGNDDTLVIYFRRPAAQDTGAAKP